MHKSINKLVMLSISALIILLVTLYFGVRLKGYTLINNVSLIEEGNGLRFDKYGVAYIGVNNLTIGGGAGIYSFTVEAAFKPSSLNKQIFSILFSIHNGVDEEQLIIGQWKSNIIVMNGNDYAHKRGVKRLSVNLASRPNEKIFFKITSGKNGAFLFLDGELVREDPELFLKIPKEPNLLLTLGNSVYGNQSWAGELYGLALLKESSENDSIFEVWQDKGVFQLPEGRDSFLFIDVTDAGKNKKGDSLNGLSGLVIPEYFPVLKKKILSPPLAGVSFEKNSIIDILINLFGFIPLGFILVSVIKEYCTMSLKQVVLISVLFCFFTSLFIEVTQAWIPSRSSQSLDLILNTVGGFLGALAAVKARGQRSETRDQCKT